MFIKSINFKIIIEYLGVAIGVFISGLIINSVFQAQKYYNDLFPYAQLAVFLQKDNKVSKEIIYEKLINLEGVVEAAYVSENDVFDTAVKIAPDLKDVVIDGENPFSAYYLVKIDKISYASAQDIKEKILFFSGIDEVRFDKNTFIITENLNNIIFSYKLIIKSVIIIGILLVIVKLIIRKTKGNLNFKYYLNLLLGAIGASVVGCALYYLFGYYFIDSSIIILPAKYLTYFLASGLWIRFVLEN